MHLFVNEYNPFWLKDKRPETAPYQKPPDSICRNSYLIHQVRCENTLAVHVASLMCLFSLAQQLYSLHYSPFCCIMLATRFATV